MTRTETIVSAYAHDYRDMKISQDDLVEMLNAFLDSLNCNHYCLSECRRSGCNCDCGEYHIP